MFLHPSPRPPTRYFAGWYIFEAYYSWLKINFHLSSLHIFSLLRYGNNVTSREEESRTWKNKKNPRLDIFRQIWEDSTKRFPLHFFCIFILRCIAKLLALFLVRLTEVFESEPKLTSSQSNDRRVLDSLLPLSKFVSLPAEQTDRLELITINSISLLLVAPMEAIEGKTSSSHFMIIWVINMTAGMDEKSCEWKLQLQTKAQQRRALLWGINQTTEMLLDVNCFN